MQAQIEKLKKSGVEKPWVCVNLKTWLPDWAATKTEDDDHDGSYGSRDVTCGIFPLFRARQGFQR